ncbi:MAG TPA: ABC transporter permease [Candidatus Acidoferrum sp.]|nr:ABC transporter permease [Candidatus Acidoferrum sp.]
MTYIWQDLRYALRALAKNKGFTTVALLTLALGMGATTAIFSVVNAVLLAPLPFAQPERLIKLEERHPDWASPEFTYANFADMAKQTRTLEKLAAYRSWLFTLSGEREPENVDGYRVSAEFFNALGVAPQLGRTFLPEEARLGSDAVVVLGNGLWKRRFGSDPNIIGKTCKVNGTASRIVGVMPASFRFPEDAGLWTPLALDDTLLTNRRAHLYTVIGRLKAQATLAQARSEAQALAKAIDAENTGVDPNWNAYPSPFQERLVAAVRLPILLLFCAVGFVLLIACANVANLLLARAAGRVKEIGVRIALGAGKIRILSQLLTESIVLALFGSALGLLAANFALRAIIQLSPGDIPRLQDASMDWRVLAFTLLVTALTGMLFGVVPGLQAFKVDLQNCLRESRRTSLSAAQVRLRSALVISEIALALVLLAGAGLLTNSFVRLLRVPLGFNQKNVLTLQLFLPEATESAFDTRSSQALSAILERVRSVPGVQSASVVNSLPIAGGVSTDFAIVGRPPVKSGDEPSADIRIINSDYLRTMQIPLLRGREFSARDSAAAPKAMIINQTMANTFWPGQDPVGARVTMLDWGPPLTGEIVGVVGDVKPNGPQEPVGSMIYWPYPQFPSLFNYLVVRSAANDPLNLIAGIKAQVRAVNPEQPVSQIRTMEQVLGESLAQRRFSLTLIGIFAGLSVLLAAIGVAGVMAFLVAQRTQEMGIRMALGAQRSDVFGLVLRQGMRMTSLGLLIGLAGAFGLTRLLSGMLYGVKPGDPLTFALVSAFLIGVALLACWLPARSATRVDPIIALRYE